MIADKPEGGTIGINKETGEASIYNDVAKQWSPLSGGGITSITWKELKDKRDDGKLTPGSLYRITDYQCTTTQENTQSAGHQFDIVLLALSENKLAEEGWAMMHENDTYFANSNLSAWKVWYCLDNDKSRFAWASDILSSETNNPMIIIQNGEDYSVYVRQSQLDNENGCAWVYSGDANNFDGDESLDLEDIVYTQLTNPNIGDIALSNNAEIGNVIVHNISVGRGVIYRLIDEFNNDIKYDFKNIQFKRKITDGQYDATNGTDTWCYTLNLWYEDMCQDASIVGNTLLNDEGYVKGVYDNVFGCATVYDLSIEGANTFGFALGDNVVLSFDDDGYQGIYSNTIRDAFYNNTIGNNCYFNTIGNHFTFNVIGNGFYSNTIGNEFSSNTIGNDFFSNIIGNYFNINTIGERFYSNTIGNEFVSNTIGDGIGYKNYGNNGVELATKDDIGDIETTLSNI